MKDIKVTDHFPSAKGIPDTLYLRGALPENRKLITVVGTRKPTHYGERVAKKIISELAGYPVAIVSGLALGIDALAHEAALASGLPTIAVPGSGISDEVIYPRSHAKLAERILESGGALLSPWKDQKAAPWTFPVRNGIMAAIADVVIIIECSEASGTMITTREAEKRGVAVGAVPGDIFAEQSQGTNRLLKCGARLITSSADILKLLGLDREPDIFSSTAKPREKPLLDHITSPLSRDEFILKCGLSPDMAIAELALLELDGHIMIDPSGLIHKI